MNRLDGILRTCEHPGRGSLPGRRAHAETRLEAATAELARECPDDTLPAIDEVPAGEAPATAPALAAAGGQAGRTW